MLPQVISTIPEMRAFTAQTRRSGKTIGFVPTMGALHAGHAALVRAARTNCDCAIVSIFVNPTQFGPKEDLAKYPRTFEADRELCGAVGAEAIFFPSAADIYPPEFSTYVEVTGLQDVLCGPKRPGHFRGVATVVLKLFNIVQPDVAFFGQKDAQQAIIIRRMVRDLDIPITIHIHPTVRESDGLAMSSRNRYLDPGERKKATVLYRALDGITQLVAQGVREVKVLEAKLLEILGEVKEARLDYATILDAETLQPIDILERPALAAIALFLGTTRLIDNTILTP